MQPLHVPTSVPLLPLGYTKWMSCWQEKPCSETRGWSASVGKEQWGERQQHLRNERVESWWVSASTGTVVEWSWQIFVWRRKRRNVGNRCRGGCLLSLVCLGRREGREYKVNFFWMPQIFVIPVTLSKAGQCWLWRFPCTCTGWDKHSEAEIDTKPSCLGNYTLPAFSPQSAV